MGVTVVFDPVGFLARYPEFTAVSTPMLQGFFNEATVYHANDGSGPVTNATLQTTYLNMLTAHIAWLNAPRDADGNPASTGQNAPWTTGRPASASEGSVSVQLENQYDPGTPQWFQQTRYGSAYWGATAGYRTFRYAARPTYVPSAIFPFIR